MRRNPGATAALLQKANSQLRGEKIEKPEDELNAYISSLTQKTAKQKSVNFEDLGESISISSDIEDADLKPKAEVSSSGSKFLKKKPGTNTQVAQSSPAGSKFLKQKGLVDESKVGTSSAGNKFLKKPEVSTSSPDTAVQSQQRYGSQSAKTTGWSQPGSQLGQGRQVYSALDKASALTGKIQGRAASRKTVTPESDSDESFSALKLGRSIGDQISESQSSSVKIGRDKGKFLKKATSGPAPVAQVEPPRASVAQQDTKGKTSATDNKTGKKASPFQLKSSLKYSTDVVLTSEEESLAEFVGGLPSSSDSLEKPKRQHGRPTGRHTPSPPPAKQVKGRRSPSPPPPNKSTGRPSSSKRHGRSVSPQNKPPVIRRTPSPSPRTGDRASPGLRRRSPSPKLMRSYSDDSNVAESIIDEVADDFGFNVIMDLDELGPSVSEELPPRPDTPLSRSDSPSPVRATARQSNKDKKKSSISAQKSASEKSLGKKQEHKSPFRASADNVGSVFKADRTRNQSPFKASSAGNDSPFKASTDRERSPFKSDNKENQSLFKAGASDSPFRAKKDSSPFPASNEGSVFKASVKTTSPFKAGASKVKATKRSSSPSRNRKKEKAKKTEKKSKPEDSKFFASFGLQTMEDLLGHSVKESEYESLRSEVEEVNSEISEEIKTEKPGAYSYSQKFEESVTEIATEYDATRKSEPVYTEDLESVSERIGYSSDVGRSSASEVKTKYSGEETEDSYTDYSESETESVVSKSRYTEDEEERTYTESYTEYSEDFTKSMVPTTSRSVPTTSRSDLTPLPRRGMTTAQVQTAADGLMYSWDPHGTGIAFPGVPYGLHFVDPTPIATHVVSADSLEAMTAYSPAMLALHDMLKSQLELTREFLDTQKHLYEDYSRSIQPSFKYTTLEDTKKYIKKHRRKKLTFKEALQLVDLEMSRKSR